ncbi:MAG TPA: GMC family oxidoreductase [Solirubrobacteraceae bacterium]|jgi:choline dehydrogenase-like flavoprotein|nr:GMC family oxidoreductase [Solirubrobacteraceae bacterium]
MKRRPALALKGSLRPHENDSAFLLDPHRRGVPGRERMRRFEEDEPVDMLVIGAGAGGATLAQRLARRGWRVLVLEAGPFWDPDEDWVSDEAGSHQLYWTEPRVIGGSDPVELGKNNCGRGVGGSMVHYAGFTPRFHPSDFEVRTRDGVAADWPISYQELKPHYERLERELPVAGQWWPWGDPHGYPHSPHPVAAGALRVWDGARRAGIEMRVGPVGIANGAFGNRPHCIYRGFCLQGCKVNAKASPLVTHVPDALEHGVEIRADCMVTQIELDGRGHCRGVTYVADGRERFQSADAVAVAGYSIETPRLLLHSKSKRFPNGLANNNDLVGRGVMVQGATQMAGRFEQEMRMYKAPPPEINSEQFYETDERRGFARGFSIQTVGPLPIGWAEHVLADGHWGQALREYARDYNHWYTIGVLCELLPQPENRVTLAEETDTRGMPVARLDYSQCENDRASIAYGKQTLQRILRAAEAQDELAIDRYAHLVGGCAMSDSPATGVVDRDHRAWEIPNLFIADGSVMPTQGAANPALTIMALASRLAERLIDKRPATA